MEETTTASSITQAALQNNPAELFLSTMVWLQENYPTFRFFLERDVVWTVQKHMLEILEKQQLPYKVFNDYPIIPSRRRSISADLAILDQSDVLRVVIEFKYEPSHNRKDLCAHKFPVVFPNAIEKDIERIQTFVNDGMVEQAIAVFIDEGSFYRHRISYPQSTWSDWVTEEYSVSALWSVAE